MKMEKAIQLIKRNKVFLISTHVNPDPDALCSELAIAMYLRSLGKRVHIINEEKAPRRFEFLPGVKSVKGCKGKKKFFYDVAIILDCGDLGRIGKVRDFLREKAPIINIDHHITNDFFGDCNLVNPKASSTAEILYELFKQARCTFTKNLALNLYLGIMADTGSFRFENTTSRVHEIVSDLMGFKFSVPGLYSKVYESFLYSDLKEFAKLITQFDTLFAGQAACLELPKKVLAKFSDNFDLRDAIFKFLRSVKGIELIVIFTEVNAGKTRANLRSAQRIDVARLASHFGGGGHKRASGCEIGKNMKASRREMLKKIREII